MESKTDGNMKMKPRSEQAGKAKRLSQNVISHVVFTPPLSQVQEPRGRREKLFFVTYLGFLLGYHQLIIDNIVACKERP